MVSKETLLKNILKGNGYSYTKTRMLVFQAIFQLQPVTMSSLVKFLSSNMNRASVYRSVKLLEELNAVQRINLGWKYKIELSDLFHEHHHHIICTNCGKITDIDEHMEVEDFISKAAGKLGYQLTDHKIELFGLCAACKENTAL